MLSRIGQRHPVSESSRPQVTSVATVNAASSAKAATNVDTSVSPIVVRHLPGSSAAHTVSLAYPCQESMTLLGVAWVQAMGLYVDPVRPGVPSALCRYPVSSRHAVIRRPD